MLIVCRVPMSIGVGNFDQFAVFALPTSFERRFLNCLLYSLIRSIVATDHCMHAEELIY